MGVDPPPLDAAIVRDVAAQLNQKPELIVQHLIANKHNKLTTSYFLNLKKHLREGKTSVADARQPTYDKNRFKLDMLLRCPDVLAVEAPHPKAPRSGIETKFDKQATDVLSKQNVTSISPTSLNQTRHIADSLSDFERYDETKKRRKMHQRRRRSYRLMVSPIQ